MFGYFATGFLHILHKVEASFKRVLVDTHVIFTQSENQVNDNLFTEIYE